MKTDDLIQEITDLLREPAKPGSQQRDGCAARWSVKPIFAWYDLWVGIFWDSRKRKLYILPLPCVGVVIEFPMRHNESSSATAAPDADKAGHNQKDSNAK